MSESFDSLKGRLLGLLGLCTIKSINDAAPTQLASGTILAGEAFSEVERLQPYGLSAMPLGELRGLVVCPNGERTAAVIVVSDDPAHRPQDLEAGDVCLYNPAGSRITLKADGSIELKPANGKTKMVGDLEVTGDITAQNITAAQTIKGQTVADQNGAKTMAAMRTAYNNHGHPGGGSPNQQM